MVQRHEVKRSTIHGRRILAGDACTSQDLARIANLQGILYIYIEMRTNRPNVTNCLLIPGNQCATIWPNGKWNLA